MSPAPKSKSENKLSARAGKEQLKASLKSSGPASNGNGVPGSAYNPVLGTFHTLETAPSPSSPTPRNNGRFQTIDETEEHCTSPLGATAEFDSLSNNDSCSGESEDPKEKSTTGIAAPAEPIPGSDGDKRERIRQKNERKHQRQRERRAQELRERCSGYLMSRKLDALSQKFVAMGFSSERATMALILNEGRVEESVAWLLEGGEESKQQSPTNLDGANLKIDIADELALITALEVKFKCTKQEVERVVVACEGDLERAEDTLKAQRRELTAVPPKLEHPGDPVASASEFSNKVAGLAQNPGGRTQAKGVDPISIQLQRRDERDFNCAKPAVAENEQIESRKRNLQSLGKVQLRQDWAGPPVAAPLDKRWPSTSSSPSATYPLTSPLHVAVPQAKSEAQYSMGRSREVTANLQMGTLKEPVIVMQRPHSNGSKQNLTSTSVGISTSPPASMGWYPNGSTNNIEMMKLAMAYGGSGQQLRNLSLSGSTPQQFYPQNQYHPIASSPVEQATGWSGSWSSTGRSTRTSPSSSLAVPSSLGLFAGWASGSSGSSSPIDWNTGGSMPQCDFTSIDWSLDPAALDPPTLKSHQLYGSSTWSTTPFMGGRAARPSINGDVGPAAGLQGVVMDPAASVGSREWTSPFNGRDLFRAPRQFVTSPPP